MAVPKRKKSKMRVRMRRAQKKAEIANVTVCPDCETPTLRKLFAPTPVHFKGRGWYVKDKYNPDAAHG